MAENIEKGFLYCATCERDLKDNNFKIGYTSNDKKRLEQYNSHPANYRDTYYYVKLKEYDTIEEAAYMEKQVHKLLKAYRIRDDKEWFHCKNHDLLRVAFELESDFKKTITEEHKSITQKKLERNNKIIELRKMGHRIREIADELNISKTTVGRIVKDFNAHE